MIDSRHNPTELDMKLNSLFKYYEIPYNVVMSKVDKLKQSELSDAKNKIKKTLPELSYWGQLVRVFIGKKNGEKGIIAEILGTFLFQIIVLRLVCYYIILNLYLILIFKFRK